MTHEQIEAISAVVRAYEALQDTTGATHYMDESQTYNCGQWLASHLSKPVRELANTVGIELKNNI